MKRALLLLLLAAACDDRQAFHEPDPSLARMLSQRRGDPFDEGVMRAPPRGAIAVDDDTDEPAPPVTRDLLALGRVAYDRTCAPCHGVAGDGDAVVARRMERRKPPTLVDPKQRSLGREAMFEIVTAGYGLMPGFEAQLSRRERWAVVAYVNALEISRGSYVADLPPRVREALAKEAP